MEKNAIRRILNKDIKEIAKTNLNDLGIYIYFNENNFLEAKAVIIGPENSLYEGGYLFFNIEFPKNYPFSPPIVTYLPRNKIRIHPNIYVSHGANGGGKVCLSILGTWSGPKWTSIMDITTVLMTIQSILDENPFDHEPGQEDCKQTIKDNYNEVIKYNTIDSLILDNLSYIPEDFEPFLLDMKEEFIKHSKKIFDFLKSKRDTEKKVIQFPFYRINTVVDYTVLYQKFNSFIQDNYLEI
tara:strand:- start:1221 stop:1940 length:720 start_codon:yes stop_codon:yes gene_type:complete